MILQLVKTTNFCSIKKYAKAHEQFSYTFESKLHNDKTNNHIKI